MRFIPVTLCLLVAATSASADLVMEVEHTALDDGGTVTKSAVHMSGERIHFSGMGGNEGTSMIFQGDANRMVMVDETRKEYMYLDESMGDDVSEQLSAMQKQMEEQLANLPPEQAEMMRKMMEEQMPGLSAAKSQPKVDIQKTGDTEKILDRKASRYDVMIDGQLATEVWISSWKDAGITSEEFQPFRDMMAFYKSIMESLPFGDAAQQTAAMQSMAEIDGAPVLLREWKDGEVISETRFLSYTRRDVPPSTYEPPADFTERNMFQQ